jgi:hypothetical protein
MVILHCSPRTGSHTAIHIGEEWKSLMETWDITPEMCHVVISDNAANMVKTFADLKLDRVGCFVHTTQLALRDGLLA